MNPGGSSDGGGHTDSEPETMSFWPEVFVSSLCLKRHSFDVCHLFTWSSLKRCSFVVDLATIKYISMMMCHLIAETNYGGGGGELLMEPNFRV